MKNIIRFTFLFFACLLSLACKSTPKTSNDDQKIKIGAENTEAYLPLLLNKRVALVVNHTSVVKGKHLLDSLLDRNIDVVKIFAPEHGFRGEESAGAKIDNSKDSRTGLPIISLYGSNKKPTPAQLKDVDILIFDIQDVGVRFYTYISTLYYCMQAAAEKDIPLIVLDRPNPNGHYVAGPVLQKPYESFVGIVPIPVVYGLTIGELATMMNKEAWIGKMYCDLTVIKCENYDHTKHYELPIKPSPNLPNQQSIWLYPSLCGFEPTKISVGRGTDLQFQIFGGPQQSLGSFAFTPVDKPGAKDPVNEGIKCFGQNLSKIEASNMGFDLTYLFDTYQKWDQKESFFTNEKFFNLLMGTDLVLKNLKAGISLAETEKSWQEDLEKFKTLRKKYLLYSDF